MVGRVGRTRVASKTRGVDKVTSVCRVNRVSRVTWLDAITLQRSASTAACDACIVRWRATSLDNSVCVQTDVGVAAHEDRFAVLHRKGDDSLGDQVGLARAWLREACAFCECRWSKCFLLVCMLSVLAQPQNPSEGLRSDGIYQ
jgi:hypothetical protein